MKHNVMNGTVMKVKGLAECSCGEHHEIWFHAALGNIIIDDDDRRSFGPAPSSGSGKCPECGSPNPDFSSLSCEHIWHDSNRVSPSESEHVKEVMEMRKEWDSSGSEHETAKCHYHSWMRKQFSDQRRCFTCGEPNPAHSSAVKEDDSPCCYQHHVGALTKDKPCPEIAEND